MLLIFVFNTPGEHILSWPLSFLHPTYEGLNKACVQVLRIILMLAALAVLLTKNSKEMLISGFYFLSFPFRFLGLNPERFAARLLLTLHYVSKRALHQHAKSLKQKITSGFDELFVKTNDDDVAITLISPEWRLIDYLLLTLCIAFAVSFLFRGF